MNSNQSMEARRNQWESFANEDPCHYICTDLPRNDDQSFWESGQKTVKQELLPLIARYKLQPGVAMEFGCGLGRLALPLAHSFDTVVGLDIAPTMVAKATLIASQRGVHNIKFMAIDQPDQVMTQIRQHEGKVNLAYSLLVFQHIGDTAVIAAYIEAISKLLAPTGIGYLQFDTRPRNVWYRAKTVLPDMLLLPQWRRGIRRMRRERAQVLGWFADNSLTVLDNLGSGTEYDRYIVSRADSLALKS